jgi:hypothetical protein
MQYKNSTDLWLLVMILILVALFVGGRCVR